jgi:3-methyladenine DNA glycosylase AlkD
MNKFREKLLNLRENKYAEFSKKLIPDTNLPIIGVRVPLLKKIVKEHKNDHSGIISFINEQHKYYEEQFLHGLFLSNTSNDIDEILKNTDEFMQQIDNWAVCDSTVSSLKIFKQNKEKVLSHTIKWLNHANPYAVRFAIVTLMQYFLDATHIDFTLKSVCNIKSEHYYVNMAIAWFFSVSLAKYYDNTLHIIEEKELPLFVHNKTIQKCIESFRITDKQKQYLKTLKK